MLTVPPIPHDIAVALCIIRPDSTLIPIGFWRDDPSTDPARTDAGIRAQRYRYEVAAIDTGGAPGPTVVSSRGTEPFRDHAAHMADLLERQALLESLLPWPGDYLDDDAPSPAPECVADLLDAAPIVSRQRGDSWDRLDPSNRRNGSCERSAGGYAWPSGLSHYVRKYGLRLPAEFLAAIATTVPVVTSG